MWMPELFVQCDFLSDFVQSAFAVLAAAALALGDGALVDNLQNNKHKIKEKCEISNLRLRISIH